MMSQPPAQAVILAGGRGRRLRPLTDTMPKPMIPFHGRPFLSYLLDQVRAHSFERVLLLVGYLANQIRDYFGDGSRHGLKIGYVEDPVEAATGQRLRTATPQLDPTFLLMYCDNYCPVPWERLRQHHGLGGALATMTVYTNRDAYTRNNVRVDDDGRVMTYDPTRTCPGVNGVDIGYTVLSRSVLDRLPLGNVSFEHVVYPSLAEQGLLRAVLTDHRYYSVGSHERLPLTEAFLAPQHAIILDRDGVLNVRPPRAQYVRSWEEFHWLPGSLEALRLLKGAGYKLILVTNQPGVARGLMTAEDLERIHRRLQETTAAAGAALDGIYVCMHGWDDGCACRKPRPGLLYQAQRDFHLDLTRTIYVGDDERDQQAGAAAGCQTVLVTAGQSLLSWAHRQVSLAVHEVPA